MAASAWPVIATPPDGEHSSQRFRLGVAGVAELIASYEVVSAGAARLVGAWHTHPGGAASKSAMDWEAMAELLAPVARAPAQLLLVLGDRPPQWSDWLGHRRPEAAYVRLVRRQPSAERGDG